MYGDGIAQALCWTIGPLLVYRQETPVGLTSRAEQPSSGPCLVPYEKYLDQTLGNNFPPIYGLHLCKIRQVILKGTRM